MDYLSVKALHIIFIVTWFAGLFYLPRILIYQTEALTKKEPERQILSDQLGLMARRLLIIISWPSAIITLVLGISLLIQQPQFLKQPFMHLKLTFVGLLYCYQFALHWIHTYLQSEIIRISSSKLRILNEVATLLLISIVFLIVKKDGLSWIWGSVGIIGIALILMIAIRLYKNSRKK